MSTRATRSPRRRTVIALGVVLAILVAFIVRLVDIQVVNAHDHVANSMSLGLGASRTLYGTRGSIVDETGVVLAGSILLYDGALDPSNVGPVEREDAGGKEAQVPWEETSAEIAGITGQTPEEIRQIVSDAKTVNPDSQWALLKRGLTTEQYRALADLDLPFLSFTPHPARTYPDGAVGGNLVGFVGSDGDALAGLEKTENDCLSTKDGHEAYSVGKDGVVIPGTLRSQPATDGGTLQLTINRDLEWYLQQLIAEEVQNQAAQRGTVFVVEVATGKVRAAAEYPTVDPNNVDASEPDDRGSRIFTTVFEPGSTFKAITAATLLEEGAATPLTTQVASSSETFPNGARINDAFTHPAYNYTLAGALIDSSNVALSKFGTMVSPEVRHDYLARFGVGKPTDIGFLGEEPGELHPVSEWDNQTLYTTTFGQAFTVTVPQVASAYQTIANGGIRMPLTLVEGCTKADGTVEAPELPGPERIVSEATADTTALMIENVAVQGGLSKVIAVPGYRIAAKTGTAQKYDPATGGYKAGVYYTSMVGFAPADDPEYVVMVTLDEPTRVTSSAATAPAFQKAMTQVLKTYRVMPSSSAEPELLPKYQ
ncbi:MAG TPA: penicillin-binding protein 2 [Microbacterium sp.]|uniref:peptidoglycan D,D-transpeptidase FtsI family protein n=1 Tax=Microbacterium sp. TaxID=51671 RepID=UPI002D11FDE1|nr:penicillin-binding protein 2 [Microbacterium sp.]HWI32145.1 penicillin-binding protein 2 [Microbacterium sp.]